MITYLGTISLDRHITAHIYDRCYELRTPSRVTKLTTHEVHYYLGLLVNPEPIVLGHWTFHDRELKALWNTMLAYLKQLGIPTDQYTQAQAQLEFSQWELEQGINRSTAHPIDPNEL